MTRQVLHGSCADISIQIRKAQQPFKFTGFLISIFPRTEVRVERRHNRFCGFAGKAVENGLRTAAGGHETVTTQDSEML